MREADAGAWSGHVQRLAVAAGVRRRLEDREQGVRDPSDDIVALSKDGSIEKSAETFLSGCEGDENHSKPNTTPAIDSASIQRNQLAVAQSSSLSPLTKKGSIS